ncbi:MAG TPA: hypothetical protein P5081_19415 [Phycisphaerae bacterium]|nr:hypothetical protein [Phycisphaerae bacterium]HRW55045.1 hypothetical protein [Phycisphaerae bacterium]
MISGNTAGRVLFIVLLASFSLGMSCPALTLPVELDDVRFSSFEYQSIRFSDFSSESCEGSVGAIQRAVITKTDAGLMLEMWMIEAGNGATDACESDYSSDDACRVIQAQTPRMLTQDEINVVALAVDSLQSRDEAGDAPGGGSCNVPCFRSVYTRDDVTYETLNPCNDIYPAPYISNASAVAIDEMFRFLLGVQAVPGNS